MIVHTDWYSNDRSNDHGQEIKDICNLMRVSGKINRTASDLFWKNVVVSARLIHGDTIRGEKNMPRFQAFLFHWSPPIDRNVPGRLQIAEQETLENYLLNVQTVHLQICSTSLEEDERSLRSKSVGDFQFGRYARYCMSALRKSGNLTKVIIEIRTDETYMARLRDEDDTKRFRWHLEILELFRLCGVKLEIKAVSRGGDELQIEEACLVAYIEELQNLAGAAEVNWPAPKKRKRRAKSTAKALRAQEDIEPTDIKMEFED